MAEPSPDFWAIAAGYASAGILAIALFIKRLEIIITAVRRIFRSEPNNKPTVEKEPAMPSDEALAAYRIATEIKNKLEDKYTPSREQQTLCNLHITELTQKFEKALNQFKSEIVTAINGGNSIKKELEEFQTKMLEEIKAIRG